MSGISWHENVKEELALGKARRVSRRVCSLTDARHRRHGRRRGCARQHGCGHSPDRKFSQHRSPAVFWLVEARHQVSWRRTGAARADGSRHRRSFGSSSQLRTDLVPSLDACVGRRPQKSGINLQQDLHLPYERDIRVPARHDDEDQPDLCDASPHSSPPPGSGPPVSRVSEGRSATGICV